MRSTPLLLLSPLVCLAACGAEKIAASQEVCATYVACLGAIDSPEASDAGVTYGEESTCWDNVDSAATCESFCSGELATYHPTYPATPECDDGNPLTSSQVLVDTAWLMTVTESEGQYCSSFDPLVTSIQVQFAPNDDTSFPGTLDKLGYHEFYIEGACTNDNAEIDCSFEHTEGTLKLEGLLTDDLEDMSGTFDYAGNCLWTFDTAR